MFLSILLTYITPEPSNVLFANCFDEKKKKTSCMHIEDWVKLDNERIDNE